MFVLVLALKTEHDTGYLLEFKLTSLTVRSVNTQSTQ